MDDGEPFPLEGLFGETAVLFENQMPAIDQRLQGSERLTITMGFWPTWPVTRTYSAEFRTAGYWTARQLLSACDRQVP